MKFFKSKNKKVKKNNSKDINVKRKYFTLKSTLIYLFLYFCTLEIIYSIFILRHTPLNSYLVLILRDIIIFFATTLLIKYFLYMTISPWYEVQYNNFLKKFKWKIKRYRPKISVIVPAWNEEVGIISTMKSVLNNTYRKIELIVVNDGSTDNSDKIIKDFIKEFKKTNKNKDKSIIYKYKENGGKGNALNTAIGLSSGEIIISIDADCIVDKEAINNFVILFADPNVKAAVGNVKISSSGGFLSTLQYLEFLFSFYFKKADSVMNSIYIIGGAAGAFRREVFEKLGLYNPNNITEDIELSVRIQKAGMKIVYASRSIIYTEGASDLKGLISQRSRWKKGRVQTFQQHKDLFFSSDKKHRKILTFIILPFAIFGDFQLSLELIFLLILFIVSFLSNNFSSFLSGIIVVSFMFFVQIFFDNARKENKLSFSILSPIAWMMFYVTTFVEVNALVKSIKTKEMKWQKWDRKGIAENVNR